MTCRAIEILLDDSRPDRERLRRFAEPRAIVQTDDPARVTAALHVLQDALRTGKHVAGYFSYEMGYVLEPRLRPLLPERRDVPLLWFGIFDSYEEFHGTAAGEWLAARVEGRCHAGPLAHEWDRAAYDRRFERVHGLIAAGDIYQANLSFRSRFAAIGDPLALYIGLRGRSQAPHGAFIDDGTRCILSLSPELFFAISAYREITAKPMKGTAPRGGNPVNDTMTREHLRASEKDRAENLMIVDLLRNDLGRIAETGTVSVNDLFAVETYPTVHQMVSTVRAKMKPDVSVAGIVKALFPCGSVTGAPKIRAMEIIRETEESPRGVYCGAIGYFAPDGSASFNVAIRTITIEDGHGNLGIGGAVVHDSNAAGEFDECLLKARYYETARQPIELIETLRFSPQGGFARIERHMARMAASAVAFAIPFREEVALKAMRTSVAGAWREMRVRLALREDGSFDCTTAAMPAPSAGWCYVISSAVMDDRDELLRHKTNWREAYEAALAQAQDCDEVIFVNTRGRLTEGTRSNIFLRRAGKLYTPPVSDGLLPGCLRAELIAQGACDEATLYPEDLDTAEEVLFGNSLRGLVKAVRLETVQSCRG